MIYGLDKVASEYFEALIKTSVADAIDMLLKDGISRDKLESKIEIAKNLLADGVSEQMVCKVTGLDIGVIEVAKLSTLN